MVEEIRNDESKLWVDGIDRGGLFKVNDCTKEVKLQWSAISVKLNELDAITNTYDH